MDFPRMLITDRARRTAEQLYKHRLVPGVVGLIKDGSVLRNAVIKLCGVSLVPMCSHSSATLRTLTRVTGGFHQRFTVLIIMLSVPSAQTTSGCKMS